MEMVPTIVDVIAAGQLTISNTENQLNSGCTIGLPPVDDVVDRFSNAWKCHLRAPFSIALAAY